MKKYVIGGVLVVAVIAYIIFANRNNAPSVAGTPSTASPATTPTTTPPAGNPPGAGTSSVPVTPAGKYKDGVYTSNVADAFYGTFQITVTIKGGMITDVTFPQHPSGGESTQVSDFALPQLRQEAIAAQSANVNIVSGATQDSQAFQQSLASVLAQAKS